MHRFRLVCATHHPTAAADAVSPSPGSLMLRVGEGVPPPCALLPPSRCVSPDARFHLRHPCCCPARSLRCTRVCRAASHSVQLEILRSPQLFLVAGFAQGLVEALKMEDVRRALRDVIGRRSPPKAAAAAEAAEGAAAAEAAGGAGAAGAGAGNSRGLSAISTPAYSAASSVSSEVSAAPVVLEAGRAAVLGAGEPVALGGGGAGSLLTDNDAESADSAARVSGSSGTRTRSLADGTTVTEE